MFFYIFKVGGGKNGTGISKKLSKKRGNIHGSFRVLYLDPFFCICKADLCKALEINIAMH